MFLDFGWSELMLIGVVALVVIGPKDLPRAMRAAGYWIRKARSLSHEFQGHVEELMREAELQEVHDDLKKATAFDIEKAMERTIDPEGRLRDDLSLPSPSEVGAPAAEKYQWPRVEDASDSAAAETSQRAAEETSTPALADGSEPAPAEAAPLALPEEAPEPAAAPVPVPPPAAASPPSAERTAEAGAPASEPPRPNAPAAGEMVPPKP